MMMVYFVDLSRASSGLVIFNVGILVVWFQGIEVPVVMVVSYETSRPRFGDGRALITSGTMVASRSGFDMIR